MSKIFFKVTHSKYERERRGEMMFEKRKKKKSLLINHSLSPLS